MRAGEFVVPEMLRSECCFLPRQSPVSRRPARVSAGAFRARGLAVPEDERLLNLYQLTQKQGVPWSPGVDRWIRDRGGDLLPHGALVLLDIDVPMAVDGSSMLDPLRWLADRATEAGEIFDLSAALSVRTPGHRDSAHLPGWHSWYRTDPEHQVRMGALERCRHIELKARGTCPGSPGYEIRHSPDDLPVLPRWVADLAGRPRPVAPVTGRARGHVRERLEGIIDTLLQAGPGDHRRNLLFWASCRTQEMVAAGEIEAAAAERLLFQAAEENGLVAKRGEALVRRTIADGLRGAA